MMIDSSSGTNDQCLIHVDPYSDLSGCEAWWPLRFWWEI